MADTLKSKTAVGKRNVTEALRKLEQVLASYEKHKGIETRLTTHRRVAAEVCESVEIARVKMKTLSELGDEFIDIVTELDDSEFEKESPNKETVISTIETEIEGFDKKINDVMEEKEGAILDAESVVSRPPVLQTIQVQAECGLRV
jgi:capsule polysaccharide export protein KpsE/RkpR